MRHSFIQAHVKKIFRKQHLSRVVLIPKDANYYKATRKAQFKFYRKSPNYSPAKFEFIFSAPIKGWAA